MDIPSQMYTLRQVCNGEVAMPPTALFYVLGWLAFALAFVCSLPTLDWVTKGWYIIGQPSPNYWMNGTLLASWPFALVLFWQSYRQLLRPEASWGRWMLLWLVLLLVSKPSYAFVFAMVYPLLLVGRHGLGRAFSSNIQISVLASALFPLGAAVAYWQELRQKLLFWYAWAGFFAALAISAVFAQTGEEFSCWNFRWQAYIASYLLFLVSTMLVWERIREEGFRLNGRSKTVVALFALHLISGLVYLAKMGWTQSHY